MRLWIAYRLLDGLGWLIWRLNSPATVQFAAFRFVDRWVPLLAKFYHLGRRPAFRADYRANALNHLLCVFTRIDHNFTLHLELENADALAEAVADRKRGVLICTAHFRLSLAAHRALLDRGLQPLFVGARTERISGWNWGHPDPVRVINSTHADVLIRCSTHIERGEVIIAFVDYPAPKIDASRGPSPVGISPNAFAWAHLSDIPILFMASRLDPNGRIIIEFQGAPASDREGPAAGVSIAKAFVDFLEKRTGWRCIVKRPKERVGAKAISEFHPAR